MVTKTWGYLEVLGSTDLNDTFAECATLTGTETLTNKKLQLQAAAATPEANTLTNESIIKAWASIDSSGNIESSYNVDSVNRGATGIYEITLKRAFSDTNYIVVATPNTVNSSHIASLARNSSSVFVIYVTDVSAGTAENAGFSFIAIGAQ